MSLCHEMVVQMGILDLLFLLIELCLSSKLACVIFELLVENLYNLFSSNWENFHYIGLGMSTILAKSLHFIEYRLVMDTHCIDSLQEKSHS